jgi:hypothetical protein
MTRSPGSSTSPSSRTVFRVISPEGTITQTTRGAVSAWASAANDSTSVTSGRGSYPTTS